MADKLPPIKLRGFTETPPLEELCAGYDRDGIQALEAQRDDFKRIAEKAEKERADCGTELGKARFELIAGERRAERMRKRIAELEGKEALATSQWEAVAKERDEARNDFATLAKVNAANITERNRLGHLADTAIADRDEARGDVERQKGELSRLYARLDRWRAAAGHLTQADVLLGGPHVAKLASLYQAGAGHA